jgi:hypothetical protein
MEMDTSPVNVQRDLMIVPDPTVTPHIRISFSRAVCGST